MLLPLLVVAIAVVPLQAKEHKTAQAIEEVIVSARKRDESLQDIPVAVTPFTSNQMEQRGYTRMEDIAAATPGFTFDGSITSGHHSNAVIRGLSPQFTIARVQNVSFFMDGVYLPRQSMLNIGLIDMERVEVVKGPQNALYGRNAFAGAVNYISQKPSEEFSGYVSVTAGSHEREDLRVAVGGALTDSGRLSARIAYGVSDYDGHTDNDHPVKDADPTGPNTRGRLGGWHDEAYNFGLRWMPTDDMEVHFGYYHSEVERETQPGYMISGLGATAFGLRTEEENDLNCNFSTQPDISGQQMVSGNTLLCGELPKAASDITFRTTEGIVIDPRGMGALGETDFYTLGLSWVINDAWTLNYLFGYAEHGSSTTGGPGGEDPTLGQRIPTNIPLTLLPPPLDEQGITRINSFAGRPNVDVETFASELRFDWALSEHATLSFGGYYSEVEDTEWVQLFLNSLCNADNVDNCNQPTSAPSPIASESVATTAIVYDQGTRQHAHARSELTNFVDQIYAVFASYNVDVNDRLSLTLEARYSQEDKRVERLTDSFAIADGEEISYSPLTDPILPIPPTTLTDNVLAPKDEQSFRYFTPRFIADYVIDDEHMLYLSVAKGLKTGGFNNAEDSAQLTYDVSENITYELGSKNTFLDGRLVLNGALYYIDWTNLQGSEPPTHASLSSSDMMANIGDASSAGAELSLLYNATSYLSLDLGLSYSNPEYDDGVKFSPASNRVDCDGSVCPADGEVGGNKLPRSSQEQASLGINLMLPPIGQWMTTARLDANYQSEQYVTPLNVTTIPERTITNASVNISDADERWNLNIWGKNILDEDAAAYAFYITIFNQYLVSKLPGPSYGATLKYRF